MRKSWNLVLLLSVLLTIFVSAQEGSLTDSVGINLGMRDFYQVLTEEEKVYLAQNKVVRVCADPSWMPYERISNGIHEGISADYLDLVSGITGFEFQLVPTETWSESLEKGKARECDIFPLVMETPERSLYMNFTTPFVVIPLVIATTMDKPFIADLPDILDQRIGLVKGYAFTELLRTEYPEMAIVEFDTIYDGLAALEKNEIYGFIDNLTTISYEIGDSFTSSIKISGRVNRNWDLGIAVRNDDPLLFSILNKAVNNIDPKVVQELESKWLSVTYEHRFNYSLLWKILAVVLIVVVLLIYRARRINIFNRKLQDLNMRLQESEGSYRSLVTNAHEGIAVVQNRKLVYANPRLCEMTGYDQDELLDLESFLPLIAPEVRGIMMANHQKRIAGKSAPVRYESLFMRKDDTIYPIELTGVLISWKNKPATLNIISDISERKAAMESVRFMALHDTLTHLPNRYLMMERLEQALAQARRAEQPLGVLFLDLNGFKKVNDTYGHEVGDLLLEGVADRLKELMRDSDTLARIGGDEFVILMPQVDGKSGIDTLIIRIHKALETPFQLNSLEIKSSTSIGFSIYPEDGERARELLNAADQHMYRVKQESR